MIVRMWLILAMTAGVSLDVRFVSIVSRLGLDTLYLIVSTGAHLYLESTTYHHYYYTTRGAAAGAPIGISGSGTTSLLPPSERVAMFAPRRARSGLGSSPLAAPCRLPSLPRTSPLLYTPVYFVPLYLPLYLHCIQTWAGYIVSQCIHRHPPLYLTSRYASEKNPRK